MRIAVMADIHSNHIALETCFAEAQRRNAEIFIFLGDYLGDLAYPQKTLEYLDGIKKKYPCIFIRGNKEDYWINHKNGKHRDWVWEAGRSGSGMLAYVYNHLTLEQIENFEKMPISMTMHYQGFGILGEPSLCPRRTLCTANEYPRTRAKRKRSLISQASRVVVTVGLEPTTPSM